MCDDTEGRSRNLRSIAIRGGGGEGGGGGAS